MMVQLYSQSYETPWSYGEEEVRAVSPLVAQGVIEGYTFPSSADIYVQSSWSIIAHNIGTDGVFAAGIVNVAGNPGNMTVIWEGAETIIPPGNYFRIRSVNPEPNCTRLNTVGEVKFAVAGSYNIKLWAMHEGAPDEWFYDDERVLTVNVAGAEWPVTKQELVFKDIRLSPGINKEAWSHKEKSNVDTSTILGGKIDYSILFEAATIPGCTAYIFWNNVQMAMISFWPLDVGKIKSGSIDIPMDKIGATNSIAIALSHVPLTFNRCLFNVYVTLGYSQEPEKDDPWEEEAFWDWIMKNAWWMSLGVIGMGLILMFRPGASPPIIIVQPPASKGG